MTRAALSHSATHERAHIHHSASTGDRSAIKTMRAHRQAQVGDVDASSLRSGSHKPPHCDLCRNVPHHFGQLAGTDFVEEAVEFYLLWHRRARTKQRDIVLDRALEIHDGNAIAIKHGRDVSV